MKPIFRERNLCLIVPLLSVSTIPATAVAKRPSASKSSHSKSSTAKRSTKAGKAAQAARKKLDYALCDATKRGDLVKMRELISRGANVNVRDTREGVGNDMYDAPTARVPLMQAVQKKSPAAVRLLLSHGANPNVLASSETFDRVDEDLRFSSPTPLSPLDLAAKLNQPEMIKALIKAGSALPKLRDGGTVMTYAAAYDSLAAAKVLLDAGVSPSLRFDNLTPLIYASLGGHLEMAKQLVSRGAQLDTRGVRNETALISAIDRGNLDIALVLVRAGANPNIEDFQGRPALIHLCSVDIPDFSQIELPDVKSKERKAYEQAKARSIAAIAAKGLLVKELVKHGATPNKESDRYPLPLLFVIEKGDAPIAIALLESGAAPEKTQPGLPSPLRLLCQSGKNGRTGDVLAEWTDGTTPPEKREKLLKNARESDATIARALFARGASLKHGSNRYALTDAVEHDNVAVVKVLLEHGADPNLPAPKVTPFVPVEMRMQLSRKQVVEYEKQTRQIHAGRASVETRATKTFAPVVDSMESQVGHTPLQMAAKSGNLEMVQALLSAGARASQRDAQGHSALWTLAVTGRNLSILPLEILYASISRGRRDMEKMAYDIASPLPAPQAEALLKWADEGDEKVAAELIRQGAPLDDVNARGVSLLDAAVMYASPAVVEELLQAGALSARKGGANELAIEVVTNGRRQLRAEPNLTILQLVFRQIEEFEADLPKSKDPKKPVVLEQYQKEQVAEFAKIREEMFKQRDYFLNLYGERDARVIRALQKQSAPLDTKDKYGLTPLMRAVRTGQIEVARALLEAGADANATDNDAMPLLSQVIAYGERRQPITEPQPMGSRVQIMLGENGPKTEKVPVKAPPAVKVPAGRDATIRNVFGREDAAIISMLLQHGADPTRTDAKGRTAAGLAKQLGHTEALAALSGK